MKNLFKIFLATAAFFIVSSCSDDNDKASNSVDQLPPATQTGANTFGCLINGKPFVIKNTSYQVAIYQGGLLQFGAQGMTMKINDPFSINNQIDLTGKARYIVNPDEVSCYYDFEHCFGGNVKFTRIDQVNHIISGTFEFSTVNDDCETIHITNGRFDLQYIP